MNVPNITVSEDGKTMTIVADISGDGKKSDSGKSIVVSSTNGNKKVETALGEFRVGVNIYKPVEGKK